MLPMLTKKDSALGLLICASKAQILFRCMLTDNKPCLKGKEYDFTTDEFANEVVKMWCDLYTKNKRKRKLTKSVSKQSKVVKEK